jgi:hypothetical protein
MHRFVSIVGIRIRIGVRQAAHFTRPCGLHRCVAADDTSVK